MKNNLLIFISLLSIIMACNKRSDSISELKNSNDSLRKELIKLQDQINRIVFRPIISVKSDKIKLKESYIAEVRLAMVDTLHPPIVILCDYDSVSNNFILLNDTLPYDAAFQSSYYETIPKQMGKKSWYGKVVQQYGHKNKEYYFGSEYEVVK